MLKKYSTLKTALILIYSIILCLLFRQLLCILGGTITSLTNVLVERKQDLLKVDISGALKFQNWQRCGFDKEIRSKEFVKSTQVSYLSNLESKERARYARYGEGNGDRILSNEEFNNEVSGLSNDLDISCTDLEYNGTLEYYVYSRHLEVDFITMRESLLSPESLIAAIVSTEEEKDMTAEEVVKKKWSAFGTAAIWLESENCYVAFTRLMYSKNGDRHQPLLSLVSAQAYDKEWNEIFDKRIMFRDVKMPSEVQRKLERIQSKIDHSDCEKLKDDDVASEECIAQNINILRMKNEREEILDKYSIQYPCVLDVPFQLIGDYNGPEDPHVVLKKDNEGEEPIIIFNMATNIGRRMHAFMPHRRVDSFVELDIPEVEMRSKEKNWAPFTHPHFTESSDLHVGNIHLIYDYNPLEILSCSLLTGHCSFVFREKTLTTERDGRGIVRGGTQFVPLPDSIPQVKGINMWLGFPKSHVERCGCGSAFYRPALSLLIESNGIYHIELMSPNLDFNEEVLGWSLMDTKCSPKNVLSPSSISNWHLVNQNTKTGEFEDYLTLTISEADAISKRVVIRGVLNYILGIYRQKSMKEALEVDNEAKKIVGRSRECVMKRFKEECKRYGLTH